MSFLNNLINPPNEKPKPEDQYRFDNSVYETLDALTYVMNPSIVVNANFATLGPSGTTAITQADGDNAEFSDEWKVFGAANATYTLTPTAYPTGVIANDSPSTIPSASDYYIHVDVTAHNGGSFYFYQRENNTVRKYQKNFLTYGVWIRNNQNKVIKIRMELFNFYDPSSSALADNTIYLQPGLNKITSQVTTEGLAGKTVGAGNYTEFRLSFQDLVDGTADLDLYQLKCEFGKVSTLLEQ
jgi:hypothetical protein